MSAHYNSRKYDDAKVQAELEGKTFYEGSPCKVNPKHVQENGTSLRETLKYRCLACRREQEQLRNNRRRQNTRLEMKE